MSDPRPPATPPHKPADATGQWSSVTPKAAQTADSPTLTASGLPLGIDGTSIPNPFGRYAIDRILGRGGMGAVFLAHDPQLDRPVALKIPTFRGSLSADQKERFFREARAIAALRHPNICPVYDVDEDNGTLYLTMHFIDGPTLATVLRDGPMDQNKAAELIRRVALGMHAAHEHGTIHRDLKPANIMIDPTGEPVVMDFGLARKGEVEEEFEADAELPTNEIGLTQMGSVLGTPAYMPPEQAVGDLPSLGPHSDVYSLGAVFYECLTGRRPFDGPDTASVIQKILHVPPTKPREILESIDPGLERVCLKAMAKRPEDRYESMAKFAAAIKNVIDPELVAGKPPPLPPVDRRPRREKKRRWISPLGCVALTLVIMTICVGVPTIGIWIIFDKAKDMVKELNEASKSAETEWKAIAAFWQAPDANAPDDVLFPQTFPDGYRRNSVDPNAADAELGINLAGKRAVYTGPNGEIVEVRAYRCTEAEAKAIQSKVQAKVQAIKAGSPSEFSDNRKKVIYTASDTQLRTVTFGFADNLNQNQEFGKIWYNSGWLFYFKTWTPLTIEFFPSKYLMEVAKQAGVPKKEPKSDIKPKPATTPKKPLGGQFGNLGDPGK